MFAYRDSSRRLIFQKAEALMMEEDSAQLHTTAFAPPTGALGKRNIVQTKCVEIQRRRH